MKRLLMGMTALLLSGCGVDYESACAELGETQNSEKSERTEILKSYGMKPTQAAAFDQTLHGFSILANHYDTTRENVGDPDKGREIDACYADNMPDCPAILELLDNEDQKEILRRLVTLNECLGFGKID